MDIHIVYYPRKRWCNAWAIITEDFKTTAAALPRLVEDTVMDRALTVGREDLAAAGLRLLLLWCFSF